MDGHYTRAFTVTSTNQGQTHVFLRCTLEQGSLFDPDDLLSNQTKIVCKTCGSSGIVWIVWTLFGHHLDSLRRLEIVWIVWSLSGPCGIHVEIVWIVWESCGLSGLPGSLGLSGRRLGIVWDRLDCLEIVGVVWASSRHRLEIVWCPCWIDLRVLP